MLLYSICKPLHQMGKSNFLPKTHVLHSCLEFSLFVGELNMVGRGQMHLNGCGMLIILERDRASVAAKHLTGVIGFTHHREVTRVGVRLMG